MLVGAAQGGPAVVRDEAGVEAVRGDVHRVHRLPSGTLARVVAGQGGVDRSESLVQLRLELTDEQPEVGAGRRGLHERTLDRRNRSRAHLDDELDLEPLGVLDVERHHVLAPGVGIAVGEELVPAVLAWRPPGSGRGARGTRR